MKEQDQIKALAELDGLNECVGWDDAGPVQWKDDLAHVVKLPSYLTSYDAIIPLIQKHKHKWLAIEECCQVIIDTDGIKPLFAATPAQLCEALLRAVGKWTE